MPSDEKVNRWFDPNLDWGKVGKTICVVCGIAWTGLQGWQTLRDDIRTSQADLRVLSLKIEEASAREDARLSEATSRGANDREQIILRIDGISNRMESQDRLARQSQIDIATDRQRLMATEDSINQLRGMLQTLILSQYKKPVQKD